MTQQLPGAGSPTLIYQCTRCRRHVCGGFAHTEGFLCRRCAEILTLEAELIRIPTRLRELYREEAKERPDVYPSR